MRSFLWEYVHGKQEYCMEQASRATTRLDTKCLLDTENQRRPYQQDNSITTFLLCGIVSNGF